MRGEELRESREEHKIQTKSKERSVQHISQYEDRNKVDYEITGGSLDDGYPTQPQPAQLRQGQL